MTPTTVLAVSTAAAEEFHAPGLELFNLPSLLGQGGPAWLAKPALLAVIGSLAVIVLFWVAFSSPKLVPGKVQSLGELGYEFVRDQIGRPFLGKNTEAWMPFLLPLFFFVWIYNLMGVLPVFQFPVMSRIAFPMVLALGIWILSLYLGFKHQGFVGYIKALCVPEGLPKWVYIIATPIEFLSNVILRHVTHAVRLFATMMAGHVLLALFAIVGWHFLVIALTPLGAPVGVLGVVATIGFTAFEMFIQALQAFVFTMLAAMFIGGALEPAH